MLRRGSIIKIICQNNETWFPLPVVTRGLKWYKRERIKRAAGNDKNGTHKENPKINKYWLSNIIWSNNNRSRDQREWAMDK